MFFYCARFYAIFIGRYVDEISLAAVNTANPVFSFIWGLSMMVMIGGAVAAGKYFGEKNIKAANEVFTNSIIAVFSENPQSFPVIFR